jgi:hypothetical protein
VRPAGLIATRVPRALTEAVADTRIHPQVLGQDCMSAVAANPRRRSPSRERSTSRRQRAAELPPGADAVASRSRPSWLGWVGACRSLRPARRWPAAAN